MIKLNRGDGTGRPLRKEQENVLKWLEENWAVSNVLAIQAPTGVGKSLIAKAIVDAVGGHVITPTNLLLSQYAQAYPKVTLLKGFGTYECVENKEQSCGDTRAVCRKFCAGCPASLAATKAKLGGTVFANPISYRALQFTKNWVPPEVLVIDEAHKLFSMARLMFEDKIMAEEYALPYVTNQLDLRNWMDRRIDSLRTNIDANFKHSHTASVLKMAKQWQRLTRLRESLDTPENIVMEWRKDYYRGKKKDYLYLNPIEPPQHVFDKLLRAKKVVLMSATLFPSDVEKLVGGRPYKYLDVASPIPVKQRPVHLRPMESANKDTSPAKVAEWIQGQLKLHPGNAIIHVSYVWAARLRPFSFYTVANFTPEEKAKAVKKFKAEGGVFLAAGCAEGLDLPHDECRTNIIPILPRENMGDKLVQRRRAKPGGERQSDLEMLRTLIQQVGRSTRDITDWSVTVVGDPQAGWLIRKYKQELSRSFTEAVDGSKL